MRSAVRSDPYSRKRGGLARMSTTNFFGVSKVEKKKIGISKSQIVFYATNSEGETLTFWIGSDHFDKVEEAIRQARKMELGDYEEVVLTPEKPKEFYV